MTDPNQQQDEPAELDLDSETVADLEVDDTDRVRGGYTGACKYQTKGDFCSNPCWTGTCVTQ